MTETVGLIIGGIPADEKLKITPPPFSYHAVNVRDVERDAGVHSIVKQPKEIKVKSTSPTNTLLRRAMAVGWPVTQSPTR